MKRYSESDLIRRYGHDCAVVMFVSGLSALKVEGVDGGLVGSGWGVFLWQANSGCSRDLKWNLICLSEAPGVPYWYTVMVRKTYFFHPSDNDWEVVTGHHNILYVHHIHSSVPFFKILLDDEFHHHNIKLFSWLHSQSKFYFIVHSLLEAPSFFYCFFLWSHQSELLEDCIIHSNRFLSPLC